MWYSSWHFCSCATSQLIKTKQRRYCLPTSLNNLDAIVSEAITLNMTPFLVSLEQIGEDEVLICIVHFHKEIYNTFGTPILIKVRTGERFHDIKERIQKAMKISDDIFETYKIAVVVNGQVRCSCKAFLLFHHHASLALFWLSASRHTTILNRLPGLLRIACHQWCVSQ